MKNTTNVLLKGMTSDMHPLTITLQEYTDALNATLITFNGNELMMQNDMGNARIYEAILDSQGNIVPYIDPDTELKVPVALSPGFVPVGIKEHGGVIYIASVNKNGEGELGSIPSPVITFNNYLALRPITAQFHLGNNKTSSLILIIDDRDLILVNVGEMFMVSIKGPELINDRKIYVRNHLNQRSAIDLLVFSTINMKINLITKTAKKGIYKFELYSVTADQIFKINTNK